MIKVNPQLEGRNNVQINAENFPKLFYMPCDPKKDPYQIRHFYAEVNGSDIDVQTTISDADTLKTMLETKLAEIYAKNAKAIKDLQTMNETIKEHYPDVINIYETVIL